MKEISNVENSNERDVINQADTINKIILSS